MSGRTKNPSCRRTACLYLDYHRNPGFVRFIYSLSVKTGKNYNELVAEAVQRYAESLDLHD